MLFSCRPLPPTKSISLMIVAVAMLATACATVGSAGDLDGPTADRLALVEPSAADRAGGDDPAGTPVIARGGRVTTVPPPVELGTTDNPFTPLPPTDEARALRTASGVIVPVIDERPSSWLVSTPCQGVAFVAAAAPIGRAHVVLDPGHGGAEPGAVGATGLTEKDLNLRVARLAAEILERAGATVVLTRTDDYTITAASRGLIAKAIDPALLVSIHHNGGAPAGGATPGTIVYTKTGSPAAARFGGLLHQTLQPMLAGAGEWKRQAYRAYADARDEHEAAVVAYEEALAARDAILAANSIEDQPPVPVPDPPVTPAPFLLEPVREFSWAGSGNAGVRSWTREDGKDYLAVLRHSGDVPGVLAEFVYLSNPAEEELLTDPTFVEREAGVLADAIVLYFTTTAAGTGHVGDQYGDQPIGGSGGIDNCVEPRLD